MSFVNHSIRNFDSLMWHKLQDIASSYPNASRVLALPIAIEILIRDSLINPARCIEEVVHTVKSINAYRNEKNSKMFFQRYNDIQWHSFQAVKYLLISPLSPIRGIIDAIVNFVRVSLSPFKTAKINAAWQDLSYFLEEKKFKSYQSFDGAELVDFANETEFAKAAWTRFKQQVSRAKSHEEVKNLHFLDTEIAKQEIINEVALKELKRNEADKLYTNTLCELHDPALIKKLKKTWKDFQHQLIKSSYTEASSLTFAPNLD